MKYKIVEYDLVNDIWILKKKVFWIFYRSVGVGRKEEVAKIMNERNEVDNEPKGDDPYLQTK